MTKDLEFQVGDNAAGRLLGLIQRIERLNEERDALGDDIKEVFAEAKGEGFDPKTMRKVISLRKMDPGQRKEMEAQIKTYMAALEGK